MANRSLVLAADVRVSTTPPNRPGKGGIDLLAQPIVPLERFVGGAQVFEAATAWGNHIQFHCLSDGQVSRRQGHRHGTIHGSGMNGAAAAPVCHLGQFDAQPLADRSPGRIIFFGAGVQAAPRIVSVFQRSFPPPGDADHRSVRSHDVTMLLNSSGCSMRSGRSESLRFLSMFMANPACFNKPATPGSPCLPR